MSASGRPIVVLASPGASTNCVANALRTRFDDVVLVLEQPVSRWQLLRRRAQRLGYGQAFGQALFSVVAVPLLQRRARRRIDAIVTAARLDPRAFAGTVHYVPSVNADATRALLRTLDPAVVVVNGTRIIGERTLRAVEVPFINTHYGITPRYRGVHGGYWARAEGRPELMGTTIHLVDTGIDTGRVLRQVCFAAGEDDDFATYPWLHLAAVLPTLLDVVEDARAGTLAPADVVPAGESKLWHHPTLWGYAWRRIHAGVR